MNEVEHTVKERRTPENDILPPLLQSLLDPAYSLEPHQFGHPAAVRNRRNEPAFGPCTHMLEPRNTDFQLDISQRIVVQFADLPDAGTVDVPEREMIEQIAERGDPQLLAKHRSPTFADSAQKLDVVVQNIVHSPQ